MAAKKEIKAEFSVQIIGGQATPQPPLGPILGQNGINPGEFCNQFNEMTKDMQGDEIPGKVTVFKDGSFKIKIGKPTPASLLKKAAKIKKGSANPRKEKVGKVTRAQVREIAEIKMPDLNTKDIDAAMRTVEGTARSLGLEVID